MKTTINSEELKALSACDSGYNTFVEAYGDSTVKFSQFLESNGFSDVLWLLEEIEGQLSQEQVADLTLLSCDYAESVLHHFENKYLTDDRPRLAIKAKRDFVLGKITGLELKSVMDDAMAAAMDADNNATACAGAVWLESCMVSDGWSASAANSLLAKSAAKSAASAVADSIVKSADSATASGAIAALAWFVGAGTGDSAVCDSAAVDKEEKQKEQLKELLLKWESKKAQ